MGKRKATDEQIISAYSRFKNLRESAKELNMHPQCVFERLQKLNINTKKNYITIEEKNKIKELYESGFENGDGKIQKLMKEIGRNIQQVSFTARQMGLTNRCRMDSDRVLEQKSIRRKEYYKTHEHSSGMLGKVHSQDTRDKISVISSDRMKNMTKEQKEDKIKKMLFTKIKNNTLPPTSQRVTWKQGKRIISEVEYFFRSSWRQIMRGI